jgi:hypothetical protein
VCGSTHQSTLGVSKPRLVGNANLSTFEVEKNFWCNNPEIEVALEFDAKVGGDGRAAEEVVPELVRR